MTVPALPPMLKPFEEAASFVRERTPHNPEFYRTLDNESRLRGFTIAGLMKMAALNVAHELATQAIVDGTPIGDFNDRLASIIEENGGSLLSKARLDLIFRNNNAIAASAGRYRQIIDTGIAELRPYGQYPLGPNDSHTTPVCRRLQGLVFRLDSNLAKRIWPPNHHGERHINVTTLTEEQAIESGRLYDGSADDEFPFLEDPATGQAARVMPNPGFNFDPSIFAADGAQLAVDAAAATQQEIEKKVAADYGLVPLADVVRESVPRGTLLRGQWVTEDKAWRQFRASVGFRGEEASTFIADHAGDGVIVTRESFDAIYGSNADMVRYFGLLVPSIEEPFEAWLIPAQGNETGVSFIRRYIGLYRTGPERIVAVVVDRAPNGWLMRASVYGQHELPESLRRGLLTSTKSQRR